MKAHRFTRLVTTAFGLAAFSTAGCSEKEKLGSATLPSAEDLAPATATTNKPDTPTPAQVADAARPDVASADWIDIKDCTYDMRAQFFAGLARLEARVEQQVAELTAQRAAMTSTTYTEAWDIAMKEMTDARSYLKSMGAELRKATPETWDQQKEKVGLAWVRAQEAYREVKSSTTS